MAIRAFRRQLSARATPEQIFQELCVDDDCAVWIDVSGGAHSAHSVLARGELQELSGEDALDQLRELWGSVALEPTENTTDDPTDVSVPLGLVVVVPYDHAAVTIQLPDHWQAPASWSEPLRAVIVRQSISVNWASGLVTAWMLGEDPEECEHYFQHVEAALSDVSTLSDVSNLSSVASVSDAVSDAVDGALPAHTDPSVTQVSVRDRWRDTPSEYRKMIGKALDAIRDGEAYQLCVTTQVEVDSPLADWELHHILRQISPAPHQALLRLGAFSMVSASPETFLRLDRDGVLTTRPIKGTRPRGQNEEEDQRFITDLVESEKEQAENLMIVDLMRNDFLRVCAVDSVRVTELFEVETFATVHQLVSTVTGTLAEGHDGIDALKACFPAGSMTGAPKSRAVSLLSEWESGPRGVYSGTWGWLRGDFTMELAMTIRTVVLADGVARIGAGGGITWSSQVDEEVAEVGHKAKRLLEALGVPTIAYS